MRKLRSDRSRRELCGTVAPVGEGQAGGFWLRGLLGVAAGFLSAGIAAGETPAATEYLSAAAAPAEWRNFSKRLQQRMQERLAAPDDDARRFREAVASAAGKAGDRPFRLNLRAWVAPGGNIERVEFDGIKDGAVAENLQRLLRLDGVGAPPPDMLQPVRLGLSLRPKEPEGAGKQ